MTHVRERERKSEKIREEKNKQKAEEKQLGTEGPSANGGECPKKTLERLHRGQNNKALQVLITNLAAAVT